MTIDISIDQPSRQRYNDIICYQVCEVFSKNPYSSAKTCPHVLHDAEGEVVLRSGRDCETSHTIALRIAMDPRPPALVSISLEVRASQFERFLYHLSSICHDIGTSTDIILSYDHGAPVRSRESSWVRLFDLHRPSRKANVSPESPSLRQAFSFSISMITFRSSQRTSSILRLVT